MAGENCGCLSRTTTRPGRRRRAPCTLRSFLHSWRARPKKKGRCGGLRVGATTTARLRKSTRWCANRFCRSRVCLRPLAPPRPPGKGIFCGWTRIRGGDSGRTRGWCGGGENKLKKKSDAPRRSRRLRPTSFADRAGPVALVEWNGVLSKERTARARRRRPGTPPEPTHPLPGWHTHRTGRRKRPPPARVAARPRRPEAAPPARVPFRRRRPPARSAKRRAGLCPPAAAASDGGPCDKVAKGAFVVRGMTKRAHHAFAFGVRLWPGLFFFWFGWLVCRLVRHLLL